MTASEIISYAYKAIGSLALGQNLTAEQAHDGLIALKNMIASWSIQKLTVPYTIDETLTLVSSQGSYTWGSGGNFTSTRPIRIITAFVRIGDTDYPVDIISKEEYFRITEKSVASRPEKLVYEITHPTGKVTLYPVPDSAYSLHVSSWKPLTTVATLSTDMSISFPEEYNEPLITNLACVLGLGSGIPLDADLKIYAANSMRLLKSYNVHPVPTAVLDNALYHRIYR